MFGKVGHASAEYNLAKLHGNIASEWHPTKNNGLSPEDVTPGTHRKVWWQCAEGHEWPAVVNNRVGNGSGCPQCALKIHRRKLFRSFEEGRKYVHNRQLKNQEDWLRYTKSGNKPDDIPASPEKAYKGKWKGIGDWLGTGRVANRYKIFRPFEEARTFARSLGLKSEKYWRSYCRSGEKPEDIPYSPNEVYKEQWIGMGDWLGTGTIPSQEMVYWPFKKAREYVHSLSIDTQIGWTDYTKSVKRPDIIPAGPERTYRKEWKGISDWLGTGRIANQDREFRPFAQAREFVRTFGLKSNMEWRASSKARADTQIIPTISKSNCSG